MAKMSSLPEHVIERIVEMTRDYGRYGTAEVLSMSLIGRQFVDPARAIALASLSMGYIFGTWDEYAVRLARLFVSTPELSRHLRSADFEVPNEDENVDDRLLFSSVVDTICSHAGGLTNLSLSLAENLAPAHVSAFAGLRLYHLSLFGFLGDGAWAQMLDGPSASTLRSLVVRDFDPRPDRTTPLAALHGRSLPALEKLRLHMSTAPTYYETRYDLQAPRLTILALTPELPKWLAARSPRLIRQIQDLTIFAAQGSERQTVNADLTAYTDLQTVEVTTWGRISAGFLACLPHKLVSLRLRFKYVQDEVEWWLGIDAEWERRTLRTLRFTEGESEAPPPWLTLLCERRGIKLDWNE